MPLWLRSPRSPPCVPHADPSLSPLGAPGGVSVAAPSTPRRPGPAPSTPPWPPRPHHREPAPAPQGAVGSGRRGPVPCAERCWALGPGLWVLQASSPGSRARWARHVRSATRQDWSLTGCWGQGSHPRGGSPLCDLQVPAVPPPHSRGLRAGARHRGGPAQSGGFKAPKPWSLASYRGWRGALARSPAGAIPFLQVGFFPL